MLAILAATMHTYRRIEEIAMAIAALGGLGLVVVGILGQRRVKGLPPESPVPERITMMVSGALLFVGLLLAAYAVHKVAA